MLPVPTVHKLRCGRAGRLCCVNTRNAWILYVVLRLVFFAVPFTALLLLLRSWDWPYWPAALVSTLVGALIAVSLSVIFLSKPRETASESIYEWRTRDRTVDDLAEDEAVDATAEPESRRNE